MKKTVLLESGYDRLKVKRSNVALARFSTLLQGKEELYHHILGKTEPAPFVPDKLVVSAVFSWDVPRLIPYIKYEQERNPHLEIQFGGVAVHGAIAEMIEKELGVTPIQGIDRDLDRVIPNELFIPEDAFYASTARGCPNGCSFCEVGRLEGKEVQVIDNWAEQFSPNKSVGYIMNNNVLASPEEHILDLTGHLRRLSADAGRHQEFVLDGGFDWRKILADPDCLLPFRGINWAKVNVAFDSVKWESGFRTAMIHMFKRLPELAETSSRNMKERLQCYILYGYPGDCLEDTLYRMQMVQQDLGIYPYLMRYMPPATLTYKGYVAPEWDPKVAVDIGRFANNRFVFWRCKGDFGRYMGRKADGRSVSAFSAAERSLLANLQGSLNRIDFTKGFKHNLQSVRDDIARRMENMRRWQEMVESAGGQMSLFAS